MELFFSPSSIGYLLAAIVSWIGSFKLYQSYQVSHLPATKVFSLAWIYIGLTVFLYSFPTFFFAHLPHVLGWANVLANFFLGIFLGYLVKLVFVLNFPEKNSNTPLVVFILYTIFIVVPLNTIYLPLPTFDEYNLEIWNYHTYLSVAISFMILAGAWSLAASMWYRYFKNRVRGATLPIAIAFTFGGLGGTIIINAATTPVLALGYLSLIIGGFIAFAFSFIK